MFQQRRSIGQDHIAGQVAEAGVHVFELVHVDQHERERFFGTSGLAHEASRHFFERLAVVNLGQRIGEGLLLHQLLLDRP